MSSREVQILYEEKNAARIKARKAAYYLANKDRIAARVDRYKEENKERLVAAAKVWRDSNKLHSKEYHAQNYREKKETIQARNKEWKRANPARCRQYVRKRERLIKDAAIPDSALDQLFHFQNGLCAYCSVSLNRGTAQCHMDHKTPLSRGGLHAIENVHFTCQPCNDGKGTKTHEEYWETKI